MELIGRRHKLTVRLRKEFDLLLNRLGQLLELLRSDLCDVYVLWLPALVSTAHI